MRETHPTLRAARGDPLWASRNPSLKARTRASPKRCESLFCARPAHEPRAGSVTVRRPG
jgi:hypothetical protein